MTATAECVYTSEADLARLRALIGELPNGAHVDLDLDDGRRLRGTVAARPTLQVFVDAAGREGMNALVRLEEPAMDEPASARYIDVWLDRIVAVRHHLAAG